MKKPGLLLILSILLLTQFSKVVAQVDIPPSYILSAGRFIKIKRDTFLYKLPSDNFHPKQIKEDYAIIPVTFTNNSNDTLKYIGMSCSWWDIYRTNNTQITIAEPSIDCFKNGPTILKIAPWASSVVSLTVLFPKELKGTGFKMGMIFQKYTKGQGLYLNSANDKNVIWSNEIIVP